jgi:hypothetical protein
VHIADELAAVRDGNPFPDARGKFTLVIFLDKRPPTRQHLTLNVSSLRCRNLSGVRCRPDSFADIAKTALKTWS